MPEAASVRRREIRYFIGIAGKISRPPYLRPRFACFLPSLLSLDYLGLRARIFVAELADGLIAILIQKRNDLRLPRI
jgi:hypothetical protein